MNILLKSVEDHKKQTGPPKNTSDKNWKCIKSNVDILVPYRTESTSIRREYDPSQVIRTKRVEIKWYQLQRLFLHVFSCTGSSGGICEKSKLYSDGKRKSLNTGIITVQNYASHVPPKVSHITFAHEVGHNFGSPVSYTLKNEFMTARL